MNRKTVGAISLTIVISMFLLGCAILSARAFLAADVNQDGVVDMKDVSDAILAFNSAPGSSRWNPNADIDANGRVDMRDIVTIAINFGQHE